MVPSLVDTHCHLFMEPMGRDPDAVLERAREAGVRRVVVPAYDIDSWSDVDALAARPGVFAALWLHPWVAHMPLDLAALERALGRCGAVALGEIGLDFADAGADRSRQAKLLAAQLSLARDLDLPVLLHCRKAFDELIAAVSRFGGRLRGVVHAYSRGPELARRLCDLGLHLAFGGAVTRPRARRARRSCQVAPADRLLLETDAPSIGLDGCEPPNVEPCHLAHIAEAAAAARGENVDVLARLTTQNAEALFGLG